MSVITKKVRCPLCGEPNLPEAQRCRACTRPLTEAPLPTQRIYEENLWSTPVASKDSAKPKGLVFVLTISLIFALVVNYFFVRKGPEWAHEPDPVVPGETWRAFDTGRGVGLDLPGSPVRGNTTLWGADASLASVWVNGVWDVVRDEFTTSKVARDAAVANAHAAIVVATGPAADTPPSLGELAQRAADGLTIESQPTTSDRLDGVDAAWRWEADADGFPTPNVEGVAYGRSVQRGGVRVSIVTVLRTDDGGMLLDELVDRIDWHD